MTLTNSQIRKRRTRARKLVMQALYQWQISQIEMKEIIAQFLAIHMKENIDKEYFMSILQNIIQQQTELDALIIKHAKRPLKEINPVELSILRLTGYELKNCLEIPYKVAINEALELAKDFATDDAKNFINGVLDPLSKELRQTEINF